MVNLVIAEGLKLRKSLGFKVLSAVAAALAVLVIILFTVYTETAAGGTIMNGIDAFKQSLGQTQFNIIFLTLLAAQFICAEFNNRTFGLSLFSGFSRRKLMFAKLAMLVVATVIVTTIMPAVMLVGFTIKSGFGDTAAQVPMMFRDYGLFLLGNITLAAFCALLACLIKNVGGSIGAGIGIGMLLNITAQFPFPGIQEVMKFSFITQLMYVGFENLNISFYIGVMVVTLAAMLVCAAVVIEKSELK
jgi:ABC-type transport system involved in multi-copper enzyme maturation permease subunit